MSSVNIIRETPIVKTARVLQLEGMFDIPPSERSEVQWDVALPLEERDWNIGLIVGPSGAGKTTVAREFFGDSIVRGFDWDADKSVVDGFPKEMPIKDIVALMSSVGFSSPPSWLRPFRVLSNGEQFRVTMARAMAENDGLICVDEFTSVVDRTVAQIGSHAIAKTIRRRNQKFVAVSCHYDIIEWLQPDWIYQPHINEFSWRLLQRRPDIKIIVSCVDKEAWRLFKKHHYLDTNISPSARCFMASLESGEPVAFAAVLPFPHPMRSGWRGHRTVCLPDYQGVGIGNALSEYVASLYAATGKPYCSTTGNPAMVYHRARSNKWKMVRKPSQTGKGNKKIVGLNKTAAWNRLTAGFVYVGEPNVEDAKAFGIIR